MTRWLEIRWYVGFWGGMAVTVLGLLYVVIRWAVAAGIRDALGK